MSVNRQSLSRAVLSLLAQSLICAGRLGAADPPASAQLVVYVEVPRDVASQTTITVADVALLGESTVQSLEPLVEELSAHELAGRELRFVDQDVPAGFYEALAIGLDRVEGSIGKATIRPEVPPEALRLPLELWLSSGEATLVAIRWVPRAIDPDDPVHRPKLDVTIPDASPLGSLAFVTNEGSGNLSVVSLPSRRVVDVVRTGEGPRGIVYSRILQRLYVANSSSNSVDVIDGLSRRRIKTTITQFGDEPSRVALSPDESRLYVLNYGSAVLSILDAESLQEMSRTFVGQEPRGMVIDPTSGFVYVASRLAPAIRVFDPARPDREIWLPAEVSPSELAFDRSARRLHVAGANQRILSVVAVETQAVLERLNLCSEAVGLAYNPRSRRLYASLADCRELAALSPEAGLEIESVRLDDPPGLISFAPDYRELLVASPSTHELLFYNVNSLQLVGKAAVGGRPFMAVVPR
jgi:YVTN family beta-propeller protein